MAALAADREAKKTEGKQKKYKVKATKILYKGAIVMVNTANGYAYPGVDTASYVFVGVAQEKVGTSTSADGDFSVLVEKTGEFEFAFTASTSQADVGTDVYCSDDQTVALVATTANDIKVGTIVEYISATKVRVRIDGAVK